MNAHDELAGRSVLIVEDECVIAIDLAEVLTERGATIVGPAFTIEAAFELIAAERSLDVAVLDMQLDSTCDYAIAEALAKRCVPTVFATGLRSADIPARFASVPRCEKPIDLEMIVQAVAEEIARHRRSWLRCQQLTATG